MNVHLVDGTYELFRAHFGAFPAVDPSGRDVGAVRGLLHLTHCDTMADETSSQGGGA